MMLDPGLGFGKTIQHNYTLLRDFNDLDIDGLPWLIALSRKGMIGQVTGRPVAERLAGSIAGMLAAVARGAAVVRMHAVAAPRAALGGWLGRWDPSVLWRKTKNSAQNVAV